MSKTLYSMMLDSEVVRQIDILAHRNGTNRSDMVNRILAEKVNLTTPESRVNDIFNLMADFMNTGCELIPTVLPNAMTMSLKSSLSYRYRPTVKYDVELFRSGDDLGKLSVKFRTQSESLLDEALQFFTVYKTIEEQILNMPAEWQIEGTRFVRILHRPDTSVSVDTVANALSGYIKLLDLSLKSYLSGTMNIGRISENYISWMKNSPIIL